MTQHWPIVTAEHAEARRRLAALNDFMTRVQYDQLPPRHRVLIQEQRRYLSGYVQCLSDRLVLAKADGLMVAG